MVGIHAENAEISANIRREGANTAQIGVSAR